VKKKQTKKTTPPGSRPKPHKPRRSAPRKPDKPRRSAPPEPCQHRRTRVLETRRASGWYPSKPGDPNVYANARLQGDYLRRRIECLNCKARFTEYATVTDPEHPWKDRRPGRTRY